MLMVIEREYWWRDNIVVVSHGNIKAADFKGNRYDLPNDHEFIFLIDMSVYRHVLKYEKRSIEVKGILSYFLKGERK